MKNFLFTLLSLVSFYAFNQSPFIKHDYPKVQTPGMSGRIDFFDMDNDGDEDLISWPTYTSIPIRIYLSNGTAIDSLNFIEIPSQITGSLADWDQDGLMDIVGEHQGISTIKVIRNLGGLNFAPDEVVTTLSLNYPFPCNIDPDGYPDFASWASNSIELHRNVDGFSAPQVYTVTSTTQLNASSSIAFNDIENDGLVEMFVRNQQNKVYIYKHTGTFNYTLQDSIVSTNFGSPAESSIDMIDLNNDGSKELIARNGWNAYVYNRTSGYAYSLVYTANFSYSVSTGFGFPALNDISEYYDVDGNGFMDIIGGNSIFFNNGSFVFNEIAINSTPRLYSSYYRCSDIEGDGNADICYLYIASNTHYEEVFYRSENTVGQIIDAQQIIWNLWGYEGQATDFDNDGDIDVSGYTLGKAIIWENMNDTLYPRYGGQAYDYYTEFLDMIDINGDGYEDMVTSTATSVTDEHWYRLNQSGQMVGNLNFMLSSEMHLKLVEDIDGDGIQELFYHLPGSSNHSIRMYRVNTGVPVLAGTLMTWNDFSIDDVVIRLSDYDMDGDKDLVVQHEAAAWEKIRMASNNGDNTFTQGQVISCGCMELLDVFDSNGDNQPDLHWHNGDNRIYRNLNANGTFQGGTIINTQATGTFGSTQGRAIDLNNDNFTDLVVQSINRQLVFSNQGNGLNLLNNEPATTRLSRVTDLDHDGDMDVVAEGIWYENTLVSPYRSVGTVYYDIDENGSYDSATDVMFPLFPVQLNNGSLVQYTDNQGHFNIPLGSNPGNFNISMADLMLADFQETTSPYPAVAYADDLNPIDSVSIGVKNLNSVVDGEFDVSLSGHRCNETGRLYMNFRNISPVEVDALVKVVLTDNSTFVSSNLSATQNVDTLSWIINGVQPFENVMFYADLNMPGTANMGDTMVFLSRTLLNGSLGSITLVDTLKQILTCAYDPNDKQITIFDHVYIDDAIYSFGDQTEYTIRFQNTGNDTARTVVIRDNLTNFFDYTTLRPVSASDSYNFTIDSLGIIEVRFENINLPDSTTDFLGSMGYIKFSVDYAASSPTFVPVLNQARIYFDQNPPIYTNNHRFYRVNCEDFINITSQLTQCENDSLQVVNNDFGIPFNYEWSFGSTTSNNVGSAYFPVSGSGLLNYTLQISNSQCTADSLMEINVLPSPNIHLNMGDSLACQDSYVYIDADQSVHWWNSANTDESNGTYFNVYMEQPTTVFAATTGSNGCTDTVSVLLDMISRPSPIHEFDTDPYGYSYLILCAAEDVNLNSTIGSIDWYVWYYSGAPDVSYTGTSFTVPVDPLETGFQVQNSFEFQGCLFYTSVEFIVDPTYEITLYGDAVADQLNSYCDQDSIGVYADHLVDWYRNGVFLQNSALINANISGDYTASDGCGHTLSFTIENNEAYAINQSVTVCPGSSYTFPDGVTVSNVTQPLTHVSAMQTIEGCDSLITTSIQTGNVVNYTMSQTGAVLSVNSPASSFQWLDCNANYAPIPGATQSTYTVTSNGSYAVLLNSNGCSDTSDCIVMDFTAISEIEMKNGYVCYPNPASESINIEFEKPTSEVQFVLFDAFGRSIREIEYSGFERTLFNLDIHDLRTGVYTLDIVKNGTHYQERIIKAISEE